MNHLSVFIFFLLVSFSIHAETMPAKQLQQHVQTGLEQSVAQNRCLKSAIVKLFGVYVKCADRATLRKAAKKAGAIVIREDLHYFGDTYNSKNILDGSSELTIAYNNDNKFAFARYTFPSHLDPKQTVRIMQLVKSKYGNYKATSGREVVGSLEYTWELQDETEIIVSRTWSDTTTYLKYSYPVNEAKMNAEVDKVKKENIYKYKKQNDAF